MSAGPAGVVAHLMDLATRQPDRVALIFAGPTDGDRTVTFGALWRRVSDFAAGLVEEGVTPGDRVLVLVPISIELYVAMLGVLAAGGVAVFVDPWAGRRRIADLAAAAEPVAMVGTPRTLLLRWLSSRLRRPLAITTGRATWGGFLADRRLAEVEAGAAGKSWAAPAPSASDTALVTFTTGSSGEPKGADRTHGFLLAQHRALAAELPLSPGDVDLTQFPIFALHDLASGATALIPPFDVARPDRVDAPAVLERMARFEVSTGVASPPFWDALAVAIGDQPQARPRLRRLVSGGAPVADAQLRAWSRAFPDTEIRIVYGSTEAEPVTSIEAAERLALGTDPDRPVGGTCAGRFCAGVRARIVRIARDPIALGPEGWAAWELPRGEVGELVVAGEHVGRGYFRNERAFVANKIRDLDGAIWHRMGDTGWLDGEGRFWLAGRVHSTIVRAGSPVHALLAEQAARGDDPRVRRAAVIGTPDERLGSRVVVVLESGAGAAEVAAAARARLAAASIPVDEVRVTRSPLPVDARHRSKIDYDALRALMGLR